MSGKRTMTPQNQVWDVGGGVEECNSTRQTKELREKQDNDLLGRQADVGVTVAKSRCGRGDAGSSSSWTSTRLQ